MNCPGCGKRVQVRKNLRRGKSAAPDECSNCGEDLGDLQSKRGLINK